MRICPECSGIGYHTVNCPTTHAPEQIFCPAQTYPQTRDSPREFCDELVSNYGDHCERHSYTDEDAADDAREQAYESRMGN